MNKTFPKDLINYTLKIIFSIISNFFLLYSIKKINYITFRIFLILFSIKKLFCKNNNFYLLFYLLFFFIE